MQKKKGGAFIAWGIVMLFVGVCSYIYGNTENGNYGKQLESFFNSGHKYYLGDILTTVGIVLFLLGLTFLIIGIVLYSTSGKNESVVAITNQQTEISLIGKYLNKSKTTSIELYSNSSCIYMQNNKYNKGFYKKAGYNLWNLYIDNYSEPFNLSFVNRDVFISGNNVNEIFELENKNNL